MRSDVRVAVAVHVAGVGVLLLAVGDADTAADGVRAVADAVCDAVHVVAHVAVYVGMVRDVVDEDVYVVVAAADVVCDAAGDGGIVVGVYAGVDVYCVAVAGTISVYVDDMYVLRFTPLLQVLLPLLLMLLMM